MEHIKNLCSTTVLGLHGEFQREAYKKAYIEMYAACLKSAWKADPSLAHDDLRAVIEFTQSIKDKLAKKYISLVTISFRPFLRGFPRLIREFNSLILAKIVTKKWIIHWAYVWEFFSEDGEYSHPHVHMLIYHSPKGAYEISREFKRTLDRLNKNDEFITLNCIDVKRKFTLKSAVNAYQYIQKNRIGDMIERCELLIDEKYENQHRNFEEIFSSLSFNGHESEEVIRREAEVHEEEDT